MIELREYQKKMITDVKKHWSRGDKRLIIQLPTGGGKTVIFTEIARLTVNNNKSVLVITDRKELLKQTSNTFTNFGLNANHLTAKTKDISFNSLYVAMSETIKRRLSNPDYINFVQRFDLIIIDECHKANFDKIFESLKNEQYVIGATATPLRTGKMKPLSDLYDSIVKGVKITELINDGYLSNAKSYGIPLDFSKVKLKQGEFDAKAIEKHYEENGVFDGVINTYKNVCNNTKALLFSASVETSKRMCSLLNENGITAKHVDANSIDRDEILADFEENKFLILCNVGILTTGYDCPSVKTIILYRATMSLSLFLQMVGRGSRIFENKNDFNILDFGGNIQRHDFWEADRDWNLEISKKKSKKGDIPMKTCPDCQCFINANVRICPECGYEFRKEIKDKEVIVVDLQLLTPSQINEYASNVATFEELKYIQKEKGYNKYWIARKVKNYDEFVMFAKMISPKKYRQWMYFNKSRYGF